MKQDFAAHKNIKAILLAASASALVWPQPLLAQDDADTATRSDPAPDATQADAGSAIVVTGTRRDTALMDTPISVQVLDQEALVSAGIRNTRDLERLTPALQMQSYGGWLQPALRGVSSSGASPGDSSNVAVYIDGVYQPNQAGQLFDLPDVDRIEVLKGPQGSLYGQNAAGGAILVNTLEPGDELKGRVYASYGNYDDVQIGGYVAAPLSDTVGISLSGAFQDHDGYRKNIVLGGRDSGLESYVVRGKLKFEPSDAVKLTLAGSFSSRDDSGLYAGIALDGNSVGYAGAPGLKRPSAKETAVGDVYSKFKMYQASLRGEFDVGPGLINTTTAFNRVEVEQRADADYSQTNIAIAAPNPEQSTFIQEINYVADKKGPFSWIAGLFYMHSEDGYPEGSEGVTGAFTAYGGTVLPTPPGTPTVVAPFNGHLVKDAAAAYAELSYDVMDDLTVTAGARYSYERQRGFAAFTFDGSTPPPTEFPGGPQTFESFSPRVSVVYRPSSNTSIYASYSEGFKSGLINILDFTSGAVEPENVTAYEIGFRAQPFPRSFIELSLYRNDYRDLQVSSYIAPNYLYENAAAARIDGAELTFSASPTDNLDLGASLSYMDAKYVRYEGDPVLLTVFVPNAAGTGNDQIARNVTGNRLVRSPEFVGNANARYRLPTSIGEFELFGSLYYNDGFPLEPANRVRQSSYVTLDGELSFRPTAADNLRVSIYGRNITDEEIIQSTLITAFTDGVSYAPPATYGVRFELDF